MMKKIKRLIGTMLSLLIAGGTFTAFPACGEVNVSSGSENKKEEPKTFVAKRLENESDYEKVFYVSAIGGDDSANGSYETPFKTIQKAKEEVNKVNDDMQKDIAVVLREGTFYLSESVVLGVNDGGTNGHDVIYMAYPEETVTVSGGVELTEWRRNEEGLWYTRVSANMIRNMYVDGVRATLAREPNGNSYHNILEWDQNNEKITVKTEDLKGAKNDFETCLYMEWAEPVLKTESVSRFTSKTVLNFADWEGYFLFNRGYHQYQIGNSLKCYFQNAKEFLDAPGEFWFDKENNVLYYMPRENEDMTNVSVCVPNIESVFKIEGDDRNVRAGNVVIDGLNIENTGWYGFEKYGHMDDQADHFGVAQMTAEYMAYDVAPGAVHVANADNVVVKNCNFSNLGNIGVNLYTGVTNVDITKNTFVDLSMTSVMIGPHITGVITDQDLYNPEDKSVTVHDVNVTDNYIAWIGMEFRRSAGISNILGYNVTIADNEVAYCNNIGISNGWGWSLEERLIRNNHILRNNVHHVSMNGSDTGGIYTLSYQPDSSIEENWVHEINRDYNGHAGNSPSYGLYIDEGSNYMKIYNNQLAHVNELSQFIYYHTEGTENDAQNNKALLTGDELDETIIANAGVKTKLILPYENSTEYKNGVQYMQAGLWTNENESGKYGYKIEVNEDTVVYGLGRFYINGNTANHKLLICDAKGKTVASCTVNMKTGAKDGQGFVNAQFKKPVTLKKGESYFVVSEETQYGDLYCGGLSNVFTVSSLSVVGISKGNSFDTVRNLNSAFVGINLLIK